MPCSSTPRKIIHRILSSAAKANSRYRATHAAMPTSSIHFTPSRAKNSGISSMKTISDIWPKLIVNVALLKTNKPACSTKFRACW